jgi:hypothetical protein
MRSCCRWRLDGHVYRHSLAPAGIAHYSTFDSDARRRQCVRYTRPAPGQGDRGDHRTTSVLSVVFAFISGTAWTIPRSPVMVGQPLILSPSCTPAEADMKRLQSED